MPDTAQPLWTFVVDVEGGTYIAQIHAQTLAEAIVEYNRQDPSGRGYGVLPTASEDAPVPVQGLQNVWCTSDLTDDDVSILAHILLTEQG